MKDSVFSRCIELPVSVKEAFAWHERPGALERLIPPWQTVEIVRKSQGITDGQRVELRMRVGPAPVRWVAEHRDYEQGRQFRDVALSGPLAHWDHLHRFTPKGDSACTLEDRVEYRPPLPARNWFGASYIRGELERMFRYRHETTAADLAVHAEFADRPRMTVAITGASGLIGSALAAMLSTGGHRVVRLVRRPKAESADEIFGNWDPDLGTIDAAALEGVDALIHLAGENVASGRWTAEVKSRILDSRAKGTRLLAETLAAMDRPPRVWLSASAIGFYGIREKPADEQTPPGEGFLADVCRAWEEATEPAAVRGIRIAHLRFGVVFSPRGGALARLLPMFKAGLGGRIGDGRCPQSWISLDDAIYAAHYVLMNDSIAGPVNLVAPGVVTNAEFTRVLGRVLRRPTFVPVPATALRLALGEMADEMILRGTAVLPARLEQSGFQFRYADLEAALRHALGRY